MPRKQIWGKRFPRLRKFLRRIRAFLRWFLWGIVAPPQPGPLVIKKIREDFSMADKLGYTIALPAAGAPDVVERTLTVTVDGVGTEDIMLGMEVTEHEVIVDQDKAVTVSLVDTDDAGNASEPSMLEFVATDSVAPPAPGAMGVTSIREIFEEEPPAE